MEEVPPLMLVPTAGPSRQLLDRRLSIRQEDDVTCGWALGFPNIINGSTEYYQLACDDGEQCATDDRKMAAGCASNTDDPYLATTCLDSSSWIPNFGKRTVGCPDEDNPHCATVQYGGGYTTFICAPLPDLTLEAVIGPTPPANDTASTLQSATVFASSTSPPTSTSSAAPASSKNSTWSHASTSIAAATSDKDWSWHTTTTTSCTTSGWSGGAETGPPNSQPVSDTPTTTLIALSVVFPVLLTLMGIALLVFFLDKRKKESQSRATNASRPPAAWSSRGTRAEHRDVYGDSRARGSRSDIRRWSQEVVPGAPPSVDDVVPRRLTRPPPSAWRTRGWQREESTDRGTSDRGAAPRF